MPECLAVSLDSTHEMPVAFSQMWQPQMPPGIAKYSVRGKIAALNIDPLQETKAK